MKKRPRKKEEQYEVIFQGESPSQKAKIRRSTNKVVMGINRSRSASLTARPSIAVLIAASALSRKDLDRNRRRGRRDGQELGGHIIKLALGEDDAAAYDEMLAVRGKLNKWLC